ncbi:inorganic phosphate transporter [Segatella copri]|uniref:inorganic phosphate transporter n=1 Tax=Segatella copri TaxID=165179 RepID=UPI0012915109|nr:inorganic phosphate transporter [Segatella copri]MQM90106.1 inorganic phosphate transporter [Segatella copri]MQM97637.1 inorganic phosphate transporter [Segatella copri]MQN04833.1 inorganic phosphate transporter [Segatella copri]MQN17115.1 inorganic phosphate transporter [Segatella copri]MQN18504.1 inorganic phosphate transporter [Segatella copri]
MGTIYLCIVIFLLCLAVFDLFVGVSNDAVNFLQSAIGAKVAKFRTVLIIASCGVVLGAIMSSGMMDIARHGIMSPDHFTFEEVMTLFLAVMVTDVIILDVFNTLGMPTSTTVSLVFELLGGAFILATLKMYGDDSLNYGVLLNSNKALEVIMGIFSSVIIAFVFGAFVMWLSRTIFTFNYRKHSRYSIAIFGGIAFTALSYFIFMKGLGKSPYLPAEVRDYIDQNLGFLICITFVVSAVVMEFLHLCRVNIFKFTVLMGTFALAMAFAGNDLVNFIGVPLAGLSSYQDYMANANGAAPDQFMMTSLMESAKTTPGFLLAAGAVMIIAMATSKKAQNVIKTSVDLSRQDEGDEMFGSSSAARVIVRNCQATDSWLKQFMPKALMNWINSRFDKNDVELEESAAFDVVRAAVNLVLASMLITIGTNLKLPLSTTYVTFMVAMGSSLADRAWSRESAVFRVTGVLSVIGGWFITAGVAFAACAIVCIIMHFGGVGIQACFMGLVIYLLIRSNIKYNKKAKEEGKSSTFQLMMRSRDPEIVWDLLRRQVSRTQSYVCHFALKEFNQIMDGLTNENTRDLRHANKDLKKEQDMLKKFRRQEMLGLKKSPIEIAIERNTWFHLGANSNQQFIYSLRRMLEPIKEHVDNNFNPLPAEYIKEFAPVRQKINDLMRMSCELIETGRYDSYREILAEADACKDELSVLRKKHIDRIQHMTDNTLMQISLVYLNVLQESQEFLSVMRHQLRAAKKFMEK